MLRKLIFLLVLVVFLNGCGASAPSVAQNDTRAAGSDERVMYCFESDAEPVGTEPVSTTAAATEESSTVEYFLFQNESGTINDEDGLTLLYEYYCTPRFSSPDPVRSQWVSGILDAISRDYSSNSRNLYNYATEFIELNGTEYFYSHSNYQQLGIARYDETVVSLLSLSSLYAGGTHPNAVQTAYNLDIAGQRTLKLEDVIREDAADALCSLVRQAVDEKFMPLGEGSLYEDYASTIEQSMAYGSMTSYWYFTADGLVVFYNQYELGPYAAGIIKVELPYEDLTDILLPEYFPQEADGTPGSLTLRGEWEGYKRIPITIENGGDTLLVGVEGRIYQVRLSEVMWLEDTPIAQQVLFCAMTMGQNDVLEITGGFDDESRSFAIEFIDGNGEQQTFYLHVDGFSQDP